MFDNFLGSYLKPNVLKHDQVNKKSFLFVGDRWQEIGDIKIIFEQTGPDSGFLAIMVPNANLYAEQHRYEGASDWLEWGAQVN